MIQLLPNRPFEEGTVVITITPMTEYRKVMSLSTLDSPQWQLLTMDGTVIDSDTDISSLVVTLTGGQLALADSSDSGRRRFWFRAEYDSTNGYELPVVAECEFTIQPLVGG